MNSGCSARHMATRTDLTPQRARLLWVQGTKGYRCSETCPPEQEHTLSCLCLLFAWNVDVMAGIRTAILDQVLKALCWRWQVQPKRKSRGSGGWSKLLFKLKNLKFSFFKQCLITCTHRRDPRKLTLQVFCCNFSTCIMFIIEKTLKFHDLRPFKNF